MSSTEVQTLTKTRLTSVHKSDDKRLVRTSSLEKFRRFNTFICSQQYFILPSLWAWLRTSQSGLQYSAEKTIFVFRSLIYSHLLYKLYQIDFKSLLANVRISFEKFCTNFEESRSVLKMEVAAMASFLGIQLGFCFYLLGSAGVPGGLIFLIVTCCGISYLAFECISYSAYDRKVRKSRRDLRRKRD